MFFARAQDAFFIIIYRYFWGESFEVVFIWDAGREDGFHFGNRCQSDRWQLKFHLKQSKILHVRASIPLESLTSCLTSCLALTVFCSRRSSNLLHALHPTRSSSWKKTLLITSNQCLMWLPAWNIRWCWDWEKRFVFLPNVFVQSLDPSGHSAPEAPVAQTFACSSAWISCSCPFNVLAYEEQSFRNLNNIR